MKSARNKRSSPAKPSQPDGPDKQGGDETTSFPIVGIRRFAGRLQKHLSPRRQTEQNFEAVVEFAPDAMVLIDKEDKITLVNAQTERLFGYRRSELIGKPLDSLLPKRPRHQKILHRESDLAAAKAGPRQELFGLHKDGSEFPVEVSLGPLPGFDAVSCAIFRDASESKVMGAGSQAKCQARRTESSGPRRA